jgi:hypothetical protein
MVECVVLKRVCKMVDTGNFSQHQVLETAKPCKTLVAADAPLYPAKKKKNGGRES